MTRTPTAPFIADVVIYCTGHTITYPFFDESFIAAPDDRIEHCCVSSKRPTNQVGVDEYLPKLEGERPGEAVAT